MFWQLIHTLFIRVIAVINVLGADPVFKNEKCIISTRTIFLVGFITVVYFSGTVYCVAL